MCCIADILISNPLSALVQVAFQFLVDISALSVEKVVYGAVKGAGFFKLKGSARGADGRKKSRASLSRVMPVSE